MTGCTFTLALPDHEQLSCQLRHEHAGKRVWRHWRYDDDDVLDEATEEP